MSFLEGIAGKVKDNKYKIELAKGQNRQDYDFNDDSKEVLLEFPTFDGSSPNKNQNTGAGGEDSNDNDE